MLDPDLTAARVKWPCTKKGILAVCRAWIDNTQLRRGEDCFPRVGVDDVPSFCSVAILASSWVLPGVCI